MNETTLTAGQKVQMAGILEDMQKSSAELAKAIETVETTDSTNIDALSKITNRWHVAHGIYQNNVGLMVKKGNMVTVVDGKQDRYKEALLRELNTMKDSADQAIKNIQAMFR